VSTLTHADREEPARWYIKGLMLPGERKSIEPMAARVQPNNVRSAHQAMHHLVADAPWTAARTRTGPPLRMKIRPGKVQRLARRV
jgi:SRSO17 transposase